VLTKTTEIRQYEIIYQRKKILYLCQVYFIKFLAIINGLCFLLGDNIGFDGTFFFSFLMNTDLMESKRLICQKKTMLTFIFLLDIKTSLVFITILVDKGCQIFITNLLSHHFSCLVIG
jgi:hypothetical protein